MRRMLRFERLEDRRLLAADSWIGANDRWNQASNWDNGVPTSTSDVTIDTATVATITILPGEADVVHSLTLGSNDTLSLPGGGDPTNPTSNSITSNSGFESPTASNSESRVANAVSVAAARRTSAKAPASSHFLGKTRVTCGGSRPCWGSNRRRMASIRLRSALTISSRAMTASSMAEDHIGAGQRKTPPRRGFPQRGAGVAFKVPIRPTREACSSAMRRSWSPPPGRP